MGKTKLQKSLMMLILLIGALLSLSSCDKDTDLEDLKTEGNEKNEIGDGWSKDASILSAAESDYIGAWYYETELDSYYIAKYIGGPNDISFCLEFSRGGKGREYWYDNGRVLSTENFTWKIVKTKRPQYTTDYLSIKYDNGSYKDVLSFIQSVNDQITDRYMVTEDGYCNSWGELTRHKGGYIRW